MNRSLVGSKSFGPSIGTPVKLRKSLVNLQTFVEFGCYPGSMQFLPDHERWAAFVQYTIVEPAIGRDILQLHPIENPALLRQLLRNRRKPAAQIVSLQKIQGHLPKSKVQSPPSLTISHCCHILPGCKNTVRINFVDAKVSPS